MNHPSKTAANQKTILVICPLNPERDEIKIYNIMPFSLNTFQYCLPKPKTNLETGWSVLEERCYTYKGH